MGRTTKRIRQLVVTVLVIFSLTFGAAIRHAAAGERTTEPAGWYNTDYIFAATRGVNDMDVHPAFKITLVPVTLVLDTAFLPVALVMGFFGH